MSPTELRCVSLVIVLFLHAVLLSQSYSEVKPMYLGCFLSWKTTSDLSNAFFTKIENGTVESCSDWCARQINRRHVVLIRGTQCVCSTWENIHSKMPDLIRVQDALCNAGCSTANANADLKCGGNYFHSFYCNPPRTTNSLERGGIDCGVPRSRVYNHRILGALSEEAIQPIKQCSKVESVDEILNSRALMARTDLPQNSPPNCLNFCADYLENNENDGHSYKIYAILGELPERTTGNNCYCYLGKEKMEQLEEADWYDCEACPGNSNYYCGGLRQVGSSYVSVYSITATRRIFLRISKEPGGGEVEFFLGVTEPTSTLEIVSSTIESEFIHTTASIEAITSSDLPPPPIITESLETSTKSFKHNNDTTDPTTRPPDYKTEVSDPTTKPTEPTTVGPYPVTEASYPTPEPAETTTEVPDSTTEASDSTTKAPDLTTDPSEPTPEASDPTTEAPDPTTDTDPSEPTPEASDPTTEAPDPTTDPSEPTAEASDPTTEAPDPITGSSEPTTEASDPTTNAPDPTTVPSESTTESGQSTTQTQDPTTHTHKPTTEPSQSTFSTTTVRATTEPTTTQSPFDPYCRDNSVPGVNCTGTDKYNGTWTSCVGSARKKCPEGSIGTVTWECLWNGSFSGNNPDYRDCTSGWLGGIVIPVDKPLDESQAGEFLKQLQENTNLSKPQFFGHEIKKIFFLGSQILKQLDQNVTTGAFEGYTARVVGVFGDVLTNSNTWTELNGTDLHSTGTQFISELEASTLELALRASKNNTFGAKGEYKISFDLMSNMKAETGAMTTSQDQNAELSFPFQYSSDSGSYIRLPSDWAAYFREADVVTFVGVELKPAYVNMIFPRTLVSLRTGDSASDKIVNGNLMSFTINGGSEGRTYNSSVDFHGDGVEITFRHDVIAWGSGVREIRRRLHDGERAKAASGTSTCVFWDPMTLSWSTDGCEMVKTQRSVSVCECSHLTAFAVLFDVHKYVGKDSGLEILTWVLSPLSIIFLILAIVTLSTVSVKALRVPPNGITINLCVCLLLANILMLTLMDRNYLYLSDVFCTITGVLAHYVLLSAFSFMMLEGFLLYKMVFVVFDNGKDWVRTQYIAAYGVPALIVAITGIVSTARSDHAYGGDAYCWLEGSYVWAFAGPIAAVVIVNTVILISSLRKAYNFVRNPKPVAVAGNRHPKSSLFWIKRCLTLSILLGITWIFGFFMLIPDYTFSNVAAYIFTLLNASQGVLLFIFHVVMNKKLWAAVTRRLPGFLRNSTLGTSTQGTTRSSRINSNTASLTLTFGSSFSRSKARLARYFQRKPTDFHDNMPDFSVNRRRFSLNPKNESTA